MLACCCLLIVGGFVSCLKIDVLNCYTVGEGTCRGCDCAGGELPGREQGL